MNTEIENYLFVGLGLSVNSRDSLCSERQKWRWSCGGMESSIMDLICLKELFSIQEI